MFLTNIFSKKCNHIHVLPNSDLTYCPDCGKLIKNEWYITRCACCGIKLKTVIKNGIVIPQFKYCSNCGSEEFIVDKLDQINFVDVNFAALIKLAFERDCPEEHSTSCCWQERRNEQPKLLEVYQ